MFRGGLFTALFLAVSSQVAAQTIPKSPVIAGTSSAGVGVVQSSGSVNSISADIGTWGTPYPYGENGPPLPGAEPLGASIFNIDIDVNDGGLVTFNYRFDTYDAGLWDWMDIYVQTPSGTQTLVSHLSKPGNNYGTYWASPMVPQSFSLNQWKNQRVRFVFSVQQDGWGDQSRGQLIGFSLRPCSIPELAPITDPLAIRFENGERVITDGMTAGALGALNCFMQAVQDAGGSMTLNSAFRPAPYQLHLQNVWDTWQLIRGNREPECNPLHVAVQAEMSSHVLRERPAAANGPHVRGIAFDASVSLPRGAPTEGQLATHCGLTQPRPDPAGGHHFEFQ